MTAASRQAEAEQASTAFQLALAQIGVDTIEQALALWEETPIEQTAKVSAAWLSKAVQLILSRRTESRDLAMSYYRLVRALRTGRTIADPRKPDPPYVTIAQLRHEFALLAGTGEEPSDPGRDMVPVETLEGFDPEDPRLEREAEAEARLDLNELGPKNLASKLEEINTELPAREVDPLRSAAHSKVGARTAGAASRIAMNGARSPLWVMHNQDKRCLGYIRLSRTGTPCGWCAMLISRGEKFKYSSTAAAAGKTAKAKTVQSGEYAEGDLYHDLCKCYAEPIFSLDQYNSSELFALNREYSEAWPRVTKGLSGKAAVSAWRLYIRMQATSQAQAA